MQPGCRSSAFAGVLRAPLLACLLLAAAAPGNAQLAEEPSRLESIELRAVDPERAEIRIHSSAELGLVGVRADPAGGLALQFPGHVPGPAIEDFSPRSGLVSAVLSTVDPTSRGPLTRIAIRTRRPAAHSMSTEGRWLRLRLWAKEAETEEEALRRMTAELKASLAESERAREELGGRVESLVAENRELARSFETLETRRRDLDGTLKATLGEVTEILGSLSAQVEELNREVRQAEGREEALRRQVAALEAELAGSAEGLEARQAEVARLLAERDALREEIRAREARQRELEARVEAQKAEIARLEAESSDLAARLDERLAAAAGREDELRTQLETLRTSLADAQQLGRPPAVELDSDAGDDAAARALPVKEVRLDEPRDPERTAAEPPRDPPPAAPAADGGARYFIVVATGDDRQSAESFSSGLRAKGYPSEVYWSESGFFVVTLDRLPVDEARTRKGEAVRAGDVPADSYLVAGTTFRSPDGASQSR